MPEPLSREPAVGRPPPTAAGAARPTPAPARGPHGAGRDITVLLAHYDCFDLLPRALRSLVEQSHGSWTCVVVDDSSPAPQALRRLRGTFADERLVWLRTSANVGQFRIYNELLPAVASPYVALQDADDWSAPRRFERLLDEMEARRCDVVGSAVRRFSLGGETLPSVPPPADVNEALSWRFRRAVFTGPTMLCRTSFLRAVGGFDGTTRIAGDSEFVYRAVFQGRVCNHPEPLYNYTDRPRSLTRSPETGFGSPARVAYARALRRRFYRHLLLSRLGRLRPGRLQPPEGLTGLRGKPNDIQFELRALD